VAEESTDSQVTANRVAEGWRRSGLEVTVVERELVE